MSEEQKNGSPVPEHKPNKAKKEPAAMRNSGKEPHSPRAAIVWFIIFLAIGSLVLFRGNDTDKVREFSQSEFEILLNAGRILNANATGESDRIFVIEGKYKITAAAPAAGKKDAKTDPVSNVGKYRTRVVFSEKLNAMLQTTQLKIEANNSGFWSSVLMSVLPILILLGVLFFINRKMNMGARGAMDFGKSRARMILPDDLHVKFSDIAGADEAKEEIREIVDYLKDPTKFMLVGGQIPKGCLLVGPPGTGKTLMAKAVAGEAGVPFFSISGSDFVEMFVGVGASRVRDMFEQARKNLPCLIFIDEIDAVGRSRFSGLGGGHDEREQTLNAMLVEMDGLESHNGVIVLAATNRPDVLDPALLRPGRFDRQVVMDLPDIRGRRQILDVHVKKIKVDASVDLDVVARTTPGFSGADLANLCNEAALLAARSDREAVTQADMEEARDKVCYGRERRSRKITDRERYLTAYHEAGHALVALHNEHCTPVHKVTIIPRGQAYLGATFTMPKEDVYTKSLLELKAEMAMCMGGRAAEELIIGDVTTGASADIAHMTEIAKHMVCVYGMSDLGPVKYSDGRALPHLRADVMPEDPCSQDTAREIDLEVRKLVKAALDEARNTLRDHKDELEKLAQALLERETVSREEIDVLLGVAPAPAEEAAPEAAPEADSEAKDE